MDLVYILEVLVFSFGPAVTLITLHSRLKKTYLFYLFYIGFAGTISLLILYTFGYALSFGAFFGRRENTFTDLILTTYALPLLGVLVIASLFHIFTKKSFLILFFLGILPIVSWGIFGTVESYTRGIIRDRESKETRTFINDSVNKLPNAFIVKETTAAIYRIRDEVIFRITVVANVNTEFTSTSLNNGISYLLMHEKRDGEYVQKEIGFVPECTLSGKHVTPRVDSSKKHGPGTYTIDVDWKFTGKDCTVGVSQYLQGQNIGVYDKTETIKITDITIPEIFIKADSDYYRN